MPESIVIAIDGPAGAGKSSVSNALAAALGYLQVDSGAMYRAVTLEYLRTGFDLDCIFDQAFDFSIEYSTPPRYSLNGVDITDQIRSHEVTQRVSEVSANPNVRKFAVNLQRKITADARNKNQGVVLEGRDIGSVVLPEADLKIYLTASVQERARRRSLETGRSIDELQREISQRDLADSTRADSPLVQAADAVLVDSSNSTFEQVLEKFLELARNAGA